MKCGICNEAECAEGLTICSTCAMDFFPHLQPESEETDGKGEQDSTQG